MVHSMQPRGGGPRVGHRLKVSSALAFALANVAVGFVAVALGSIGGRADWAALITTACAPPLLIITLFHAVNDLGRDGHSPHARFQAWLALLLSIAPLLLLGVFLMAAGPTGRGRPLRWLPWTRD
jgi:hypothetical protein